MRSTQVTLDKTRSSSYAMNLTQRGKGSESSRIFGSNLKAQRDNSLMHNKTTRLNADSAMKMQQTNSSNIQITGTASNQASKQTIAKTSKNFFRASSIGYIYNERPGLDRTES
jgi:hypothetical protein